jgi:hypothetical protein
MSLRRLEERERSASFNDEVNDSNIENLHEYSNNNANNVRDRPITNEASIDNYVKAILEAAERFIRKKTKWEGNGNNQGRLIMFKTAVEASLTRNETEFEPLAIEESEITHDWTSIEEYADHIVQLFCKKIEDLNNKKDVFALFATSIRNKIGEFVKESSKPARRYKTRRNARRRSLRRGSSRRRT